MSANRRALRKHLRTHVASLKDKHKCDICNKGFRDRTKLKVRD